MRQANASNFLKRLRAERSSDDLPDDAFVDDLLLLPSYGSVPRSPAFLPTNELKYFDTYLNDDVVSTDAALLGGILSPSAIASIPLQGHGAQNYSGKSIIVKSWNVRGSFSLGEVDSAAFPPEGRLAFIALVLDTQTNGTQCTSDEIFTNPGSTLAAQCNPLIRLESSPRFVVLRRKTIDLNVKCFTNTFVPLEPPVYQIAGVQADFDFFVPLDLLVNFKGSSGGITDAADNSLHVVMFTTYYDSTFVLYEPRVTCGFSSRIRFLSEL